MDTPDGVPTPTIGISGHWWLTREGPKPPWATSSSDPNRGEHVKHLPVRGVSLCVRWSLFGDDIEKLLGLGASTTPATRTTLGLPSSDTTPAKDEVAAQGRAEHNSDGRGGLLEQDPGVLACRDVCLTSQVEASQDST